VFAMASKEDNIAWLQWRIVEYHTGRVKASQVVEDFDEIGKLGQGFALVDKLEEVDLGRGGATRPMYINQRSTSIKRVNC
jgi:hypothetical protein